MSVVRHLERLREILKDIAKRKDCAEITHYDKIAMDIFVESLERAIKRYKSESARVKKYY